MNRINTFFLLFLSLAMSFLVAFVHFREQAKREPMIVSVPLKVEAYRMDRHPLPGADIYLNQKYVGRTDERGFFFREMSLRSGESYALRIERETGGFVYGPWETHFKVEEEEKTRREKAPESAPIPSLEGDSDIASELERAQYGKASIYDRYHFLALLEGNMYYTVKVTDGSGEPVEEAAVIIDGKEEGRSGIDGTLTVRYSGESSRSVGVQVIKNGRHIWTSDERIEPDSVVEADLSTMLLVELHALTEQYDVLRGIEGARVFVNGAFAGKTAADGHFFHAYSNVLGVDGDLRLGIRFPSSYIPESLDRTFVIMESLPKLEVADFAYSKEAARPKVAVMPFAMKPKSDLPLEKQASKLKSTLEDYLAYDGFFALAGSEGVRTLLRQFDIDYSKEGAGWKEIPLIKKEVDAMIFGEVGSVRGEIAVRVVGVDYTGERFLEMERQVSLRELLALTEDVVTAVKANFPVEGNILSVEQELAINLGRRHGVKSGHRFNGYTDFFDDVRKEYVKKRVVRLKVREVGEETSTAEIESVGEGYLLEAGVKIKRVREAASGRREVSVLVRILSGGSPVKEANVYLEDQWIGQSGDSGELAVRVPVGSALELLVYKEGYMPGEVAAKATEETGRVEVDLKRGESLFTVDSNPRGALVFVDGEYKGVTPLAEKPGPLPYGLHLVELSLEGYQKFREYVNFGEPKVSMTGGKRVELFREYFKIAERHYADNNIDEAIATLEGVPENHPDYLRALEFLGFIHLNDLKDYRSAIRYYTWAIELGSVQRKGKENLYTYYNAAQAHLGESESLFYANAESAEVHLVKAASLLGHIKERRSQLAAQDRAVVFQNTLFALGVCYQKLFYITGEIEYLDRARYAWVDYFDFFDPGLLDDARFKDQHSAAESYMAEIERLQSER